MQPGEWRNLRDKTTWPGKNQGASFFDFQRIGGTAKDGTGGADGFGWTQRLVYHEGALMVLAMRDLAPVALFGMDPNGTWWRRDTWKKLDGEWTKVNQIVGWVGSGWSGASGGRRPFNRLTQDSTHLYFSRTHGTGSKEEHGRTYRTPLDNPGVFEDSGHHGFGQDDIDTVGNHAIIWVEAWGRFYGYTPGGYIWTRKPGDADWTLLGRTPYDGDSRASGYAGEIAYNAVKDELVFIGGQSFGSPPGTGTKWARITEPTGELEALPDLPNIDGHQLYYTSAQNKILVDPRDGAYLLQVGREKIYRTEDRENWAIYTDLYADADKPFWRYDAFAPAARIPGTDVFVFVSHGKGVVLHRLKALKDMPEPETEPEPTPEPGPAHAPEPTPDPAPVPAPAPEPGDSVLQSQAEQLPSGGYWSPLGPETFGGVWTHNSYKNNSNDFWNPVAVWNPVQQRMYGVLDRTAGPHTQESVVILYYDAPTDSWGNVEVPDLGGEFGSPHVYGRWAFDIRRQKLYRRTTAGDVWVLDLATHEWTNTGPRNSTWRDGIAMHEGTGELIHMDGDGFVYGWNPDTDQVRTIGRNPHATDRHSHGHYNPVRNEVCIAFGNGGDMLTLVSADNVLGVTVPEEVRGRAGSATTFSFYDPLTGHYLIYATGSDGPRELWEYDPDTDRWAMALDVGRSDFAWPRYHGHLIAPVPELEVIIWLHRSDHGNNRHRGIYKHESVLEPGGS
ncbi:MAG: hypothetical protein VBE63_07770 [Lamprobacter sp.]|uniref:hypothetical protein n=1 Tax=Lamprobacter sp. TaxID=3100796 RepID=UPI002B259A4D|nr:hypothetical protein [Lamprobacter sp.]MEA3639827.1 hypothetical protein [Lamprobacter sp.]